jgi:membrane protein DedA with SNARE-associated domain
VKRKVRLDGLGYAASALGVAVIGIAALLMERSYPATAAIVLVAVVIALTGLALRWRKRLKRQRRREVGTRLKI